MTLINLHLSGKGRESVSTETLVHLLRAAPWSFGSHAHANADQILWINKGTGRVVLDGVVRGLTTNTAIFVPRQVVHEFHLTPVSAGWVVTIPAELPMSVPLPGTPQILPIPERADQAALTALCDEIHREQVGEGIGRSAALDCQAGLLTIWLARQLDRRGMESAKASSQQKITGRFLRLLEDRYASGWGAAEYARGLDISPTHLTRVVREVTGKPATTHIQDRVLLAACTELAAGTARIAEISDGLGFASPAYFTRVFTQRIGSAPSVFRRAASQN